MPHAVLVVDDEPLVLDLTASMLEKLGYEPITASDAAEALEKLADDGRIEALITDVSMPGMSGYELADAAKQQRPDLPVLFVTGRPSAEVLPSLRKPFSRDALSRVMKRTIGH